MGKKLEDVIRSKIQDKGPKDLKDNMKLDKKVVKHIEKAENKVKLYSQVGHKPQEEKSKSQNEFKDQINNQMKKQRHEADKPTGEHLGHGEEDERIVVPRKDELKRIVVPRQNGEEKRIFVPCIDEEEKRIVVPYRDDYPEIRTTTTLADELSMGHVVDCSENRTSEDHEQSQKCSVDVMLIRSEHETAATPAEEAENGSKTENKVDKGGDELKRLLLTSQSFIGPKILQNNETNGMANLRLYLDCANELTEHKSRQESQTIHPLIVNSRLHISLGGLVEEIHNAIENMKYCSDISGEKLATVNLYAMMERDIKCNGLINGTWEWSWRHGFSSDEAEQVVNEVESLVLSGLIEEVIT